MGVCFVLALNNLLNDGDVILTFFAISSTTYHGGIMLRPCTDRENHGQRTVAPR